MYVYDNYPMGDKLTHISPTIKLYLGHFHRDTLWQITLNVLEKRVSC